MRPILLLALSPLLLACTSEPETTTIELPLFGDGYRADGDQCRRVGESAYTNQFLDDAADLVACPEDMENLGVFAIDTGGVEVDRVGGYVLYSVPVR
ncbi:hypothetical protein [Tropicimonas aquimaris]|uniref:Uncharacterized protein n=1 Tax=Tropicimonas aquimaris TaxID=914152 RepID=A0ABW3IM02_9RHOB